MINYPNIYSNKDLFQDLCSNDIELQTEAAFHLNCLEFEHEKILEFLQSDKSNIKHFGLLKLNSLKTPKCAEILVSCLTNNESRVREMSSVRIREFIQNNEYKNWFQSDDIIESLCKGLIDINPRVCKNVTVIIKFVDKKLQILEKLIKMINDSLEELKGYHPSQNHKYNRIIFKLYWCVEALGVITEEPFDGINKFTDDIIKIASMVYKSYEYTIREKSVSLVKNIKNLDLTTDQSALIDQYLNELSQDSNFYVKNACL